MVCAARLLVVTALLVAGAEGEVPAPVVAGVVSSLQRHYLSGCVFLLHTAEKGDLGKYRTPLLSVSRQNWYVRNRENTL
jgi:hypothetical protein